MNGNDLFQLPKTTLDQFTNETESARVYALLAQHKQLSGVSLFFLLRTIRILESIFQYQSIDMFERSPKLTNSRFSSLKGSTINDADGKLN